MTVNTYTDYLDTTDICKDIYSDICQRQRTHSHVIKAPLTSVVINTVISVSNSDICRWKWYLSVIVNTYTEYPGTTDICSDKYSDIWQWTPTQIIQAPLGTEAHLPQAVLVVAPPPLQFLQWVLLTFTQTFVDCGFIFTCDRSR